MNDTGSSRDSAPSGRFVLRIDPALHAALREAASASGLSLNEYCTRKLVVPGINVLDPVADAVIRSASAVGEALVGIVGFGSWARGEMTASSDVDLLVVIEGDVPVTRRLYRDWDRDPLWWESHRVEPHFVHLPENALSVSGLWAEVAADGIVLFDRDFTIVRWLGDVRRQIATGRLVRRESNGHPYWIEAA